MRTFFKVCVTLSLMAVFVSAAQAQYCTVSMDTDIVIAVHDSVTTINQWWGPIVISPGITSFLRSFVTNFDMTKVRISLIAYGSTVRLLTPFTNNVQTLQSGVSWDPEFGGARTYDAVRYIRTYFSNNARPSTAKMAIFLTNRASDNLIATLSQSVRMRNDDISILGLAFGPFPLSELSGMTGSGSNIIFQYSEYRLQQEIPRIKRRICALVNIYSQVLAGRIASDTVLVLDHSDSTRRFTGLDAYWNPSLIDFTTQFVDNLATARGRCAAGIVTFSDDATVHLPITTSVDTQRDVVTRLITDKSIVFSGSNITSGIAAATDALLNNGSPNARKFMIVVVDGSPINFASMQTAAEAAASSGITVYPVSFRTLSGLAVTSSTLTAIAQDSQRIIADRIDADLPDVATDLATSTCSSVI